MFYVYLLRLSNEKIDTGYCKDLKRRLKEHISGQVLSTKNYLPLELIFYSAFLNKNKAIEFEKYLKTGSGAAFRNKRYI